MKPDNSNNSPDPAQLPQPVSPATSSPTDEDKDQTDIDAATPANLFDHPTSTKHLAAEDLDLIEKEWVQKAKEVVGYTQGDPYEQNKELNKIKADYIKKRYNRTINLK